MHAWMRDGKTALAEADFIEEKNIEIKRTRPVFLFICTFSHAPVLRFDRVQAGKKIVRRERGCDLRDGVYKGRLIQNAHRRRFIQRRNFHQRCLGQFVDLAQCLLYLQYRKIQVAAQRNKNGRALC